MNTQIDKIDVPDGLDRLEREIAAVMRTVQSLPVELEDPIARDELAAIRAAEGNIAQAQAVSDARAAAMARLKQRQQGCLLTAEAMDRTIRALSEAAALARRVRGTAMEFAFSGGDTKQRIEQQIANVVDSKHTKPPTKTLKPNLVEAGAA